LVGEEAGCVVRVDHNGAREDTGAFLRWEQGDGLVSPVVEIGRGSMTPVLVASDEGGGVV
jgi:hypothetical protein